MADGGEGTTAALVEALNADWRYIRVRDPLSRPIMAGYAITPNKDTAIIEMAAASGLHLVQTSERNPLITSTIGTGDIILDALNQGVKRIILGIGGSATNDDGAGMLTAQGFNFSTTIIKSYHKVAVRLLNYRKLTAQTLINV